MELDESRIYTAVNANEVKSGCVGYFADTLSCLRKAVEQEDREAYGEIKDIGVDSDLCRFYIKGRRCYNLFYLVEEPKTEVKPLSLKEIAKLSCENAIRRDANGGHISVGTESMLKHCATEVLEAIKAYIYWSQALDLTQLQECKDSFASELADIICCCTIIAGRELIDLDKAVADCLEKNRKRAEGTGDKL